MNVWDCALGFMDAQVLLTAHDLGVFESLATGPFTAEALAADTRLPVESAQRLLGALAALKLVKRLPDGRYANSLKARRNLVRQSPKYIGTMFNHVQNDLYPAWRYFKTALLEGTSQWTRAFPGQASPTEAMYNDPQTLQAFMEGMHMITYEAAVEFAAHAPELEQAGSIMDIGGASGAFVIAMSQQFPALHGTIYDLAPVRPIAERFISTYGLADRLDFYPGNFFLDSIPPGWDAYSLGFVLHDWNTAIGSNLLRQIANASRPGGLLIIGEYMHYDDRTGPLHITRQDLNMLVLVAARGRERTAREYGDWVREFGFEPVRIQPTRYSKNYLIARYAGNAGT